jgi:hypothetical protein
MSAKRFGFAIQRCDMAEVGGIGFFISCSGAKLIYMRRQGEDAFDQGFFFGPDGRAAADGARELAAELMRWADTTSPRPRCGRCDRKHGEGWQSMKEQEWNDRHPIGTAVRYWPTMPPGEGDVPRETRTRSEAWELFGGRMVVLVEGISGAVAVSHLEMAIE